MCGLAGIRTCSEAPVDTVALLRMREAMHTRGPDGAGLWTDPRGGLGLAHRRLAILGLCARRAGLASAGQHYNVAFNGEQNQSIFEKELDAGNALRENDPSVANESVLIVLL